MVKKGGRYFRQMEPYEKWHRMTKGMACLENGEKFNKDSLEFWWVARREIERWRAKVWLSD